MHQLESYSLHISLEGMPQRLLRHKHLLREQQQDLQAAHGHPPKSSAMIRMHKVLAGNGTPLLPALGSVSLDEEVIGGEIPPTRGLGVP